MFCKTFMKKLIIILLSALFVENVNGQTDSATMERLGLLSNTKTELIQKCRSRIFDAISEGDRDRAIELMLFAKTTFEDNNYQVFYPDEFLDLAIWLRKYNLATSEIALLDSTSAAQFSNHNNMLYGDLSFTLRNLIKKDKEFFEKDICADPSLTSCERDFLLLYLKKNITQFGRAKIKSTPSAVTERDSMLISTNDFEIWNQETLNSASNNFLERYPASQFDLFVKNHMRHEYKTDALMYGVGMDVGASLIGGDLADVLTGSFDIGISCHLYYKGAVAGARIDFSFNKPKEDLSGFATTFGKDVKLDGHMPSFYLGYRFAYRKMMLMPTVGYGKFSLNINSPIDTHTTKESCPKTDWGPVFSIEIGSNTDIRYPYDSYATRSIDALGVRYSYHPVTLKTKDCNYNGVVHNVTLMYRITWGKLKRVY